MEPSRDFFFSFMCTSHIRRGVATLNPADAFLEVMPIYDLNASAPRAARELCNHNRK